MDTITKVLETEKAFAKDILSYLEPIIKLGQKIKTSSPMVIAIPATVNAFS